MLGRGCGRDRVLGDDQLADGVDHQTGEGAHEGAVDTDELQVAPDDEMRNFADSEVVPHAHEWHLKNEYIPLEVLKMSELGVFGLTIPEEYGGLGLGKESMCVVSEELSRGYIGVGSLGTRSEIAAELILGGGTDEQKSKWLPQIASGEMLPTAVFTEPNTGSDLASLKTRAVREGDVYKVYGNKTWITHPVRADLMTLLVRTNPKEPGHRGLSMLLAEKPRGDRCRSVSRRRHVRQRDPGDRLSRHEGIRDRLRRLRGAGGGSARRCRGAGLQATDADLRIRAHPDRGARDRRRAGGDGTGARYARGARQFGEPLIEFPRVADKIAMMAVEIMIARQLTYFAARAEGFRPPLRPRGRHGQAARRARRLGRGRQRRADPRRQRLSVEYPVSRVLCDARILSIFEGAAEIQAQVIARRLLDGRTESLSAITNATT